MRPDDVEKSRELLYEGLRNFFAGSFPLEEGNLSRFLQNALDSLEAGVMVLDPKGTIVFSNQGVEALYGFASAESIGKNSLEYTLPKGDREKAKGVLECFSKETSRDWEGVALHKEGYSFFVRVKDTPLFTEEGSLLAILRVVVDREKPKESARELRGSEQRQRFLLRLNDSLSRLGDPLMIQAEACRSFGEFFSVQRVTYAEIHGEDSVICADYVNGVAPRRGTQFPVTSFGGVLNSQYRSGEVVAVEDVSCHPDITKKDQEVLKSMGIGAFVGLMLIKEECLVGSFIAYSAEPRAWSNVEKELTREVAERIGSAVARTKAETALRASKEEYQALFNAIDEGFCSVRLLYDSKDQVVDFMILETNQAQERISGLASMVGKTGGELAPSYYKEWLPRLEEVAQTGISTRFEWCLPTLWHYFSIFVARIGDRGSHTLCILFDEITSQKRRELNLACLAEIGEKLIQASTEQEIIHVLGLSLAGYLGISSCFFIEISKEQKTAHVREYYGLHEAGDPRGIHEIRDSLMEEVWDRLQSKEVIVVDNTETTLYPLKEAYSFEQSHAFVVIPFLREAQTLWAFSVNSLRPRAWRSHEVSLLREVANRAGPSLKKVQAERALREEEEHHRALAEQLQQAHKRKDEFLNMLSHELRNPLSAISMNVALLEHVADKKEQVEEARKVMDRQCKHLTRLMEDLLEITRITRSLVKLKEERVELQALVEKVVTDFRPLFRAKNQSLVLEYPSLPIYLQADPVRLTQVIGNLLDNAVKFLDAGHETVVTITPYPKDATVEIAVFDNGPGIAKEMIPHLFEPFAQAENTMDRGKGGLGLGLAIVKAMVELHNGTVDLLPKEEGAHFVIRLPYLVERFPLESSCPIEHETVPDSLRILAIDDIEDVLSSLGQLLGLLGHEVKTATNAKEGLELALAFSPEVVICDIGLKETSGYEVAKSFRRHPDLRATFLIAFTGYTQVEDKQRAKSAGFDAHLAKPLNLTLLQSLLAEVVERKKDSEERAF